MVTVCLSCIASNKNLTLLDVEFQSMIFSVPFPNSPWGANKTEYLVSDCEMGSVQERSVVDTNGPLSNLSSELEIV